MNILGISAFYHDSAACLVRNGEIIAAAQEERFSRKKHDSSFPRAAVEFCLSYAQCTIADIDIVVFYDKPFLKFDRLLHTYLAYAPTGIRSFLKAIPVWIKKKIWMKELIAKELSFNGKILFSEHHLSHAASAFFPSPFNEAAYLTVDGVGEWTTTSYGIGRDNTIEVQKEINFPHSLGLLYSAFTYYTGFKVNSGEYKLMGLAPYGEPRFKEHIEKNLIDVKDDGSFHLNMRFFNYCAGLTMTNEKFHTLFGGKPRRPESKITQRDMDLARSIQEVTEDILMKIVRHVYRVTKMKNLCLAGGVSLNCVANGKILREGPFERLWIQPAAGDAGGALGAALAAHFLYNKCERAVDDRNDLQKGTYLGPEFTDDDIKKYLDRENISYKTLSEKDLPYYVAALINEQNVIGWFQGRMEFGPRALGARSILGNATSEKMQETINLKIKFRESFRPFAPSVLKECAKDYFELASESPYMLIVAPVDEAIRDHVSEEENKRFGLAKLHIKRSSIPAVTHVDYSARVQTVEGTWNKRYYELIKRCKEKYDMPVIINTSFNVRGEPIVCTPDEAYLCFMRTNMDYLVMGTYVIKKTEQKPLDKDIDWLREYELD